MLHTLVSDKTMQSRACVLAVSLLALASVVMAQQQCPADSVTEENGQLIFAELSEGAGLVDATYDPGSLGAWNSLANGFVNAVRSGGLPYGEGIQQIDNARHVSSFIIPLFYITVIVVGE